ncbi:MAG: imidazole glycerol phosphate synthase subunit HisH [Candidatus Goldiibacteriota bacterium]|jgi:glutamine amidotransferase
MKKRLAVIDYGMGNLHSVIKAMQHEKIPAVLTDRPEIIAACAGIILPGVGAFNDAIREIKKRKIFSFIKEEVKKGKPIMGICLGMQLLFTKSYEFGEHAGFGFIKGTVRKFNKSTKVPHIGWNSAELAKKKSAIMKGIKDRSFFYFVHSYYASASDKNVVLTKTRYGNTIFTSAVESGNVFGFQFHPEKSSEKGLRIYKNFYEICVKSGSVKED